MAQAWFETVAEAQRRAQKRLPSSVYSALIAGSEKGRSSSDNLDAFDELGFAPHVANLPRNRDLTTTVMGLNLPMPIVISPTGVQAVHPDGEGAVARAAVARGIPMGLSSFASKSIEDVSATGASVLFQMYWSGTRDQMLERLDRAKRAGAKAIIVTLDWSFSNGRDWGSPWIPDKLGLKNMIKLAPQGLSRPSWLWSWVKSGALPTLGTPNMAAAGETVPTFFGAYYEWMQTPLPTWEDLAWLRSAWEGPFLVKGVCRVDDAKRVRDLGATALSVSNHGGNNVDSTPSPLRALAAVVDVVGSEIDVLLDGGVRRGGDVVKAVSLGAKAVMIGRAYLWGLAANGQAGVENVLDVLRSGIDSTMTGIGAASVRELSRADVVAPKDFHRCLGA